MAIQWGTVVTSALASFGTISAGLGTFYWKWRTARRDERKEDQVLAATDKKEALSEYQQLVDLLERKIERLNTELTSQKEKFEVQFATKETKYEAQLVATSARYDAQVASLTGQVATLRDNYQTLLLENVQLRGELRLSQATIAQLRSGLALGITDSWVDAIIIADISGTIKSANSLIEPIFHYRPEELIGCNLIKLIPPELVPAHVAGMKRLIETGKPPSLDKILKLQGLAKGGERVPIDIRLTAWQVGKEWVCEATIRPRFDGANSYSPDPFKVITEDQILRRAASGEVAISPPQTVGEEARQRGVELPRLEASPRGIDVKALAAVAQQAGVPPPGGTA